MREDYIHYLWKYQKWRSMELKTTHGMPVTVISPGQHNLLSGPDFFNSRLRLGEQEWAGNVEMHLKSSDWYVHGHEADPAYDNVVLHVVWEHDLDVYRKDDSALPVLELKNIISPGSFAAYCQLTTETPGKWINCENEFSGVDDFTLTHWLERIYVERLEKKAEHIFLMLNKSSGDWEEVLFKMLAKNFGLNINGEAFLSLAQSIPISTLRKCSSSLMDLEALFFGQMGLLDKELEEPYHDQLKKTFLFLKKKYALEKFAAIPVKYFRLRPDNFPEIRLAQLAAVYYKRSSLFSQLIEAEDLQDLREIFKVSVNDFWNTHYSFSSLHPFRKKIVTSKMIDLIMINTVVPLKFSYWKKTGKEDFDPLLEIMNQLPAESNKIIHNYNKLRPLVGSDAMTSQALLQLKSEYCDKKRCLHCAVGLKILQRDGQI